jgi:hypothetical protein
MKAGKLKNDKFIGGKLKPNNIPAIKDTSHLFFRY